jgi:hypothetical protein
MQNYHNKKEQGKNITYTTRETKNKVKIIETPTLTQKRNYDLSSSTLLFNFEVKPQQHFV